jgi:hypothetical protein
MLGALIKYALLVIIAGWILGALFPSKTDTHKMHMDSRRMTNAEIERKELERDRLGAPPLSKEEIDEIAARSVRKAQSHQR